MPNDRFPLLPDLDWHEHVVTCYADAVPPIKQLQIRRGLQQAVADMFAELSDLDLLRRIDIHGIVTRSAAFVVLDARYVDGLYEDDRIAHDFTLQRHHDHLSIRRNRSEDGIGSASRGSRRCPRRSPALHAVLRILEVS